MNQAASRQDERVVPMEGVHNFRDYGGYACADGHLTRGRLFRSAQHLAATDEDLVRIGGIGLAAVIDLRGGPERAAAPCRRPDGFSAEVIFVDEDTTGLAPHVEAARGAGRAGPSPEEARAAMTRGYAEMPFRPSLQPILRRYVQALAYTDGPTLVHCMAGKDRTGLAVALFHAAMGVHHDDILLDFMMTNVAGRVEQRIAGGARHIRKTYGDDISEAAVRVLMTVEPAYLDAAFEAIDARNGSLETYLRDELGVTAASRAAMAERLVV